MYPRAVNLLLQQLNLKLLPESIEKEIRLVMVPMAMGNEVMSLAAERNEDAGHLGNHCSGTSKHLTPSSISQVLVAVDYIQ